MTGTMENRPGDETTLFWHGKTVQQVRDEVYPGAKLVKFGTAPIRSMRPRVDYCQAYRLESEFAGIQCYLVEVP